MLHFDILNLLECGGFKRNNRDVFWIILSVFYGFLLHVDAQFAQVHARLELLEEPLRVYLRPDHLVKPFCEIFFKREQRVVS